MSDIEERPEQIAENANCSIDKLASELSVKALNEGLGLTWQMNVVIATRLGILEGMKLQRERDAVIAREYCLVPPDGGEPDELEREIGAAIASAIRSAL